jgi:hypothetical protein
VANVERAEAGGCRYRSICDNHCLAESGMLETMDPADWIGDKGYIGNGMITPIRKPPGRKLLDWEKEFNKQVNKIRYRVERAIANFKTWRIMRLPTTPRNLHTNHFRGHRPALLSTGL